MKTAVLIALAIILTVFIITGIKHNKSSYPTKPGHTKLPSATLSIYPAYGFARAHYVLTWDSDKNNLFINSQVIFYEDTIHAERRIMRLNQSIFQTLDSIKQLKTFRLNRLDGLTISYQFDSSLIYVDVPNSDTAFHSRKFINILGIINETADSLIVGYNKAITHLFLPKDASDTAFLKDPYIRHYLMKSQSILEKKLLIDK